ncbi:MAG: hypothetical protein ABIJ12_01505 [bacterium]
MMQICYALINVIKIIVTLIIAIIEWVVKTVCELVTTIIHYAKEICSKVCSWLGWFDFLCKWICKIIEWTEAVTKWVCKEVLEKILIGLIKVIVEYIFYILTWICWVINWIVLRWLDYLLCIFGIKSHRYIHVCIKILTIDRENLPWNLTDIENKIKETNDRYKQCGISLCIINTEIIETDDHRKGLGCGFGQIFTSDFHWFRRHECQGISSIVPITIYFVEDISGKRGCAIPGTNFILVATDATNATIAHEIGHLADLWSHSDDPDNVMHSPTSDDSIKLTKGQCCLIRTSRYATTATICGKKYLKSSTLGC